VNPSIRELINKPELIEEDRCNFFYDWFCNDKSLKNRALAFLPKLKFLVKEEIIDPDKMYVWFKNNCPVNGTLYDDMRFSTLEGKHFIGGLCPRTGHTAIKDKCTFWSLTTYENGSIIEKDFIDWTSAKTEIKTKPELKKELQDYYKIKG